VVVVVVVAVVVELMVRAEIGEARTEIERGEG
jgi:hypothetical protein